MEEEEKSCWCPCQCGCDGSTSFPLREDGICIDCAEGNHEVPPQEILLKLLPLHRDIVRQYEKILKDREVE